METLSRDQKKTGEMSANWQVVLACGICLFFMFGVPTYMFPWIYGEVVKEFGWTRAQATDVISVKFLVGAVSAIFIGWSVDRFGPKRITILACIIGGSAMLGFLYLDADGLGFLSPHAYYLILGGGLGLSALGVMISTKSLLSGLFEQNMGVALGLALIGTSIAGAVIPFLYVILKDTFGWREAVAVLSMGIWFVALPFYLYAVKDNTVVRIRSKGSLAETKKPASAVSISDFLKGRNFWLIVIGLPMVSLVDMGISQHLVLYLNGDLGIEKTIVSFGLSTMAVVAAFSKVLFGRIYDKTSTKGITFTYILLALTVVLLFPVEGIMTMLICLSLKGVAHGGLVVDVPVVTKHCYGAWGIGKKISIFTMIYGFGMAAGPRLMSKIHDVYGEYTYGFMILICSALIAALLMYQVKPGYWLQAKQKKSAVREGFAAGAVDIPPSKV